MKRKRHLTAVKLSEFRDGRDENNLAEFPVALLTDSVPHGVKTLEFQDTMTDWSTGKVLTRRVCITGSDKFGLPTAKDEDVLLALVQLTRITNDFSDPEVHFTKHQIIELLGWQNRGWAYDRVEESLHRWKGVSIHYWNAWRDNAKGTWRDSEAIGVIEYFRITDGRRKQGSREDRSRIVWNKALFDSFRAGYLKKLDFSNYRKLKRPAAKRAYRFLDKRFYHEPRWEFDLREFACEKLGLSRAYSTGQLKQQLNPTFGELHGIGFIEAVRYRKKRPKQWTLEIQKRCTEKTSLPGEIRARGLVDSLLSRGVARKVAEELAKTFSEEFMAAKIAIYDWLVKRRDKRVGKNPPGFLVAAIREDYPEPKEFSLRRKRDSESKVMSTASGHGVTLHTEALSIELDEVHTDDDPTEKYLHSLTDDALERLETRALAEASCIEAESYQRLRTAGGELFVSLRRSLQRKHVLRHGLHLTRSA